ncbi:hypothetical protein FEDK69T_25740 [Flavobacterium enshiense DK69]|nr:hypothetical protein FEDK69T_25740 [Flavobacterium enshiense DK69]
MYFDNLKGKSGNTINSNKLTAPTIDKKLNESFVNHLLCFKVWAAIIKGLF